MANSIYFPYFRGKQYELIAIREAAKFMALCHFVPIIAPVREPIYSLQKTLAALHSANTHAIVLINPEYGDYKDDTSRVLELLNQEFKDHHNLMVGIRLHAELSAEAALQYCSDAGDRSIALIHAGFKESTAFIQKMGDYRNINTSIFLENECGKLYQKKFKSHKNLVLIRDGFERRRNSDHPESEFFSDLHITFGMENMTGFGDFLIVGDDYQESGGPAYTVAIHLTYIDPDQDNAMFIRHFLSDRKDSPIDPGGKFAEALDKLVNVVDEPNSKFYQTKAIAEFRDLHQRGHYPGLGYIKKLAMLHHIETLAKYFESHGHS